MLTSRFLRRIATHIALLSFLLILTGCFLISGSGDVIPEDAPSDSTENTDKEPQETEPERITD